MAVQMSSPRARDTREQTRPSTSTLLRFLADVRSGMLESAELCGQVTNQLEKVHIRRQLCGWLQLHHDRLDEDEPLERSLKDQLHGLEYVHESLRSKRLFTQSLLQQLQSGDRDKGSHVAKQFIAAGLGVAFMRYSEASRFSYYHTLEMGLLPEKTRHEIISTALVPDWGGTIGWISREAWLLLRQGETTNPEWQFLWSCFCDPKGRVAMEDLVLGNRSFAAIPVSEQDSDAGLHRIVGILFCFFPVDGVFVIDHGTDIEVIETVRGILEKAWQRRQEGLLHALEVEAVTDLYENSRRSSLTDLDRQHFLTNDAADDDQTRRIRWLKQTLLPEGANDPSDPLGLQLVVDIEQDLSVSPETQTAKCQFIFREATFVREVFRRLQMSCRCPTRWAPRFVWDMQAIHDFLHESARDSCFPIWRVDPGAARDADSDRTRERALYPRIRGQAFQQFLSDVSAISAESARAHNQEMVQELYDQMAGLDNEWGVGLESDEDDPFRLSRVLRHQSAPDHMLVLIVPLMFNRRCTGFMRVKCWCDEPIHVLSGKSQNLLKSLYELFSHDFVNLRNAVSHLLVDFEDNCDKVKDDLPRLKTWLDMRLAFCDALAEGLCRGLSGDHDGSASFQDQLNLVVAAARIESQAAVAEGNVDSEAFRLSAEAIARFAEMIDDSRTLLTSFVETARSRPLPKIALLSLWLTRERPTLIGAGIERQCGARPSECDRWAEDFIGSDQSGRSRIHNLLVDDPSLMQLMRLFLRWSRQREHALIDYQQTDDGETEYRVHEQPSSTFPLSQLPVGFKTPPVYVATNPARPSDRGLARCNSIQFRSRGVVVGHDQSEVSHTTIRLHQETSALRLDWHWRRAPTPVALAHVPRMVNHALFHADSDALKYDIRYTPMARDLFDRPSQQRTELLPLTSILHSTTPESDAGVPNIIQRVNDLLGFLPNEEHRAEPLCRFVFVTIGDARYAVLAHGQIPKLGNERPLVKRLRDDAISGALADVALLMQTSAMKLTRDHRNQLRYMAHQLEGEFGVLANYNWGVDTSLKRLSKAIKGSHGQVTSSPDAFSVLAKSQERNSNLKARLDVLKCLIHCLTRSTGDLSEFKTDAVSLLEWLADRMRGTVIVDKSGIDSTIDKSLLRFGETVTPNLFLVYASLLSNALHGTQYAKNPLLRIRCTRGEESAVIGIANTSSHMLPEVFKQFLENDDPKTEIMLPKKKSGKDHRGLWAVRNLLKRDGFGRPMVGNTQDDTCDWIVEIAFSVPLQFPR